MPFYFATLIPSKRRRDSTMVLDANLEENDDFIKSSDWARGRVTKRHNKGGEVNNTKEIDYYNQCIDDDLDFDDSICDVTINGLASKVDRVGARMVNTKQ